MPGNVRKDDKSKRIAFDILGAPSTGFTDSFGNKKRIKKKKRRGRNQLEGFGGFDANQRGRFNLEEDGWGGI